MRLQFNTLLILSVLTTLFHSDKVNCQNKYYTNIVQPELYKSPNILSVSVTPENKNLILWEQENNEYIMYFNIYRDASSTEDKWVNIGQVSYPGNFFFIDGSSFPSVRYYHYNISAIDKCGNEIFSPHIHKTIKLSVESIDNNINSLMWNSYEGFQIAGYKIYRGIDNLNLTLIDSITTTITIYTDRDNPYEHPYYQVEAIRKIDKTENLKGFNSTNIKTFSNIASDNSIVNSFDTSDDTKVIVFPNPLITCSVVVFQNDSSQSYDLSIFNLIGQTVFKQKIYSGEIEIERGNLKEGLYILQISGEMIYTCKLMVSKN